MAIENNMKQIFKTKTRLSATVVGRARENFSRNPQLATRNTSQTTKRQGMSLIEVLISMFVLLFGLLGVAAIFPVGNYYVTEGEKYDFSSALAQNAFEELRGRGMLRPEVWHYADMQGDLKNETVTGNATTVVSVDDSLVMQPTIGAFNITGAFSNFGPGHAFVIDPMGAATLGSLNQVDVFPRATATDDSLITWNPWGGLSGARWPVRRITLRTPDPANPGGGNTNAWQCGRDDFSVAR